MSKRVTTRTVCLDEQSFRDIIQALLDYAEEIEEPDIQPEDDRSEEAATVTALARTFETGTVTTKQVQACTERILKDAEGNA